MNKLAKFLIALVFASTLLAGCATRLPTTGGGDVVSNGFRQDETGQPESPCTDPATGKACKKKR